MCNSTQSLLVCVCCTSCMPLLCPTRPTVACCEWSVFSRKGDFVNAVPFYSTPNKLHRNYLHEKTRFFIRSAYYRAHNCMQNKTKDDVCVSVCVFVCVSACVSARASEFWESLVSGERPNISCFLLPLVGHSLDRLFSTGVCPHGIGGLRKTHPRVSRGYDRGC